MRSRTIREGSVGILVILGLGLFSGLILWLRGMSVGNRSYNAIIEFKSADGLQEGTPVRYRGVNVGKVTGVMAGTNGVDVTIEISPPNLVITRDVIVEANKSGLIGEASIDIKPLKDVETADLSANPAGDNCPETIICNGVKIKGKTGANLDELMRVAVRLIDLYSDPALLSNVKAMAANGAVTSKNTVKLTQDLSRVSGTVDREIQNMSTSVQSSFQNINESVNNQLGGLSASVDREITDFNKFSKVQVNDLRQSFQEEFTGLNRSIKSDVSSLTATTKQELKAVTSNINNVTITADTTAKEVSGEVVTSARSMRETVKKFNVTAEQVNALLINNQDKVIKTLDSINSTATEMSVAINSLTPMLTQMQKSELLNNLEALTENAAAASANLRDLSKSVAEPDNLMLIRQTLNGASLVLQNVNKITTDVEDLTGDPKFRQNFKNLINKLGGLFASTQELNQQVQVAQSLGSLAQVGQEDQSSLEQEKGKLEQN